MGFRIYSRCSVDVIFGNGPIGFIVGKTDEGFLVVKQFDYRSDGTMYPLEGCGAISQGDYITSINEENMCQQHAQTIKYLLQNMKRPITVRFSKPCPKELWKPIITANAMTVVQKWGDNDNYLPVRIYDLSAMSDCFIMNRSTKDTLDVSLIPIYRNGPIFECDVREASYNGIKSQNMRAPIWKMLLRCYPYQPSKWSDAHQRNIECYHSFVQEFIIDRNYICGKINCELVPNPIDSSWKQEEGYITSDNDAMSNESRLSKEFGFSQIREIIWKDTERTYSDIPFFSIHNKQVFARLLYIYSQLNSSIQYVQGMNELLAPLLYVFAEDEDSTMSHEVSIDVEADTFFAFNALMSETRDLFIKQMDTSSCGLRGALMSLQQYINIYIPKIADHLKSLQIDAQYYAVRWLTTLYSREFPLHETFRLWDSLLSDPNRFSLVPCIGCAVIKLMEDQLIGGDFADVISLI